MQSNTLDPQVKNLAMAIRQAESGGNMNASGASGENGGYQFMPDTWKEWSGKYLGDSNAEKTRENQNKVAYMRIKEWKDQGKTPAQIASMWNAGEGRPDAYKQNWRGVNSQGVEYDTPAYVAKVGRYYKQFSAQNGTTTPAPVTPGPQTAPVQTAPVTQDVSTIEPSLKIPQEEPDKKPLSRRIANALGFDKTVDTLGSLLARQGFGEQTKAEGKEFVEKPTGKEIAGAALNIGSLVGGGAAVSAGVRGVMGGKLLSTAGKGAINTGLAGSGLGASMALEDDKSMADIAKYTALGGAGGAAFGGLLVPGATALMRTTPTIGRYGKSAASKLVEGAESGVKSMADMAKLAPTERAVVQSGLPDTVLNLSRTTPATQRSLSEMLDIHKRGLADRTYARSNMVKQVPAKSFLEVADALKGKSDQAAKQLADIAASNPKEVKSINNAMRSYYNALADRQIYRDMRTGKLVSRGNVPTSELKYYDEIMREIESVTRGSDQLTNMQIHRLRQRLYDTLDAATRQGGKPGERPFSNKIDADVQKLRQALAKELGGDYQQAAETWATNEKVLREISKITGVPISEISAKDRKLGEVMMRTLGNASDRPQTLIDDLVAAAERNGIPMPKDINTQIEFADLLEKLYGSTQSRTMASQVRQGVREGAEDVMGEAASGNITSAAMKLGRNLIGKGSDDQIKAFEAYINSLNKNRGLIDL